MVTWDNSAWISVLALAVSVLSFVAAIWAAWTSHRTLRQAERVRDEDRKITFERERSQLLEIINDSRSLLNKTRIHIGALKADFDAAPQSVRELMHNYTDLFDEYLPGIEAGVRQTTMLRNEVTSWNDDTGIPALVRNQAKFRALVHDDEVAHDQGFVLVAMFEKKFSAAVDYVKYASR